MNYEPLEMYEGHFGGLFAWRIFGGKSGFVNRNLICQIMEIKKYRQYYVLC